MQTHSERQKFNLDKASARCYNSASLTPIFYEVTVQDTVCAAAPKQEMLSATRTLMKNGRRAMGGLCACCGTKMSVAGKWDDAPVQAARIHEYLAEARRANG